jgi:hypothetical protein
MQAVCISGPCAMRAYLPEQVQIIRGAVARGREAMRRRGRFDPVVFARAFIEHGGIQIPGQPDVQEARENIAREVLSLLASGAPESRDATVAREVRRARAESDWTRHAEADKVVGFRLHLGPGAERSPVCQTLLNVDHGLGQGVYRKAEVAVLPPDCDDSSFAPVLEDEVEQ